MSSIRGSVSPLKRMSMYGSSSKIGNSYSAASLSSASRFSSDSV
jgi:hypothetical protein